MLIKNKEKLILIIISISLLVLFFYQLDYTALNSFDEAWYGDVSRSIAQSKNPLAMSYNKEPFFDQPPFVLSLMAISQVILGSNEFSVRTISALSAVGSIILLYLLGKKISGKTAGFTAAVALCSSMWFVFRARSGNLDIPFVFLELLTLFFLLKKSTLSYYLSIASYGALILTKTLIGFGMLPVIGLVLVAKKKISIKETLLGITLWLVIVTPWYAYNATSYPTFINRHFFEIAQRDGANNYSLNNVKDSLVYLSIGIGKWYKVFLLAASILGLAWFLEKKIRFSILFLVVWFFGFGILLLSSETEIWHLLPLYPVVCLVIGLALSFCLKKINDLCDFLENRKLSFLFVQATAISLIIGIGLYQFMQFSNLFYYPEKKFSAEKDISLKARGLDTIYLAEAFYPAAVYYSEAKVHYALINQNTYDLVRASLVAEDQRVFIINSELLKKLKENNLSFTTIEKNEHYSLISSGDKDNEEK